MFVRKEITVPPPDVAIPVEFPVITLSLIRTVALAPADEANEAAKQYLTNAQIQSAAMMVPCPWFNEIANWYKEHPDFDMGLHLAMNSEWKWYRWGPVAPRDKVPGMVDPDG